MKKLDIPYYLELQRRFREIVLYVSCHEDNFNTYSIKIENLFVDICAFFDSLCQTFIMEKVNDGHTFINGHAIKKLKNKILGIEYFNMSDYKMLFEDEFLLSSKDINLNIHEDFFFGKILNVFWPKNIDGYKIKPFSNWAQNKSLNWWNAFTKLKHNRLSNIKDATLEQVIYSLGATFIILTLKNEKDFKDGNLMIELYEIFYPLYWEPKGRRGDMVMWR